MTFCKEEESYEQLLNLWETLFYLEKYKKEVEEAIDLATLEHNRQFEPARMEDYV